MIRFRTTLMLPGFALLLSACAQPPAPVLTEEPKFRKEPRIVGRGALSSTSLEGFFALQQAGKALVFDARPGFFYSLGHVPGAISLPKSNCDESIHNREGEIKTALAAGKTIVVYCTGPGCPDARTVAMHINGFGYPATVFSGGWDAWKAAEMPVE